MNQNNKSKDIFKRVTPWILWAIILALSWHLFFVSQHKEFSHDEFEHVHSAWYIAQGALPYQDFYQTHNFLLWYIILPFYKIMGDGGALLSVLRYAMTGVLLLTAFLSYKLTKLFTKSTVAGALTAILILSNVGVAITGLEIRPDVPQILFEILALYWLFKGFQTKQLYLFALSGMSLAISFLFLQKVVLIAPALAIIFFVQIKQKKITAKNLIAWLVGAAVPIIAALIWLLWSGIFHDYILTCWTYYVAKHSEHQFTFVVEKTLLREWLHWSLFIAGLVFALISFKKQQTQALFALLSVSTLALLVFLPNVARQYILPVYCLAAISTATAVHTITHKLNPRVVTTIIIAISVIVSISSWNIITGATNGGYQAHINAVNYVIAHTNPDDHIYDGNNYFNVFRPDLHYFWYALNSNRGLETLGKLDPERFGNYDVCKLLQTYKPKIISAYLLDADMCGLADQYVPTEHRYMLRRIDITP